jgi:hypothetical protein
MNNDSDSYRPFFNRGIAPAIRELLANHRPLFSAAAQFAARRFSGPPPLPSVDIARVRAAIPLRSFSFPRGLSARNGR